VIVFNGQVQLLIDHVEYGLEFVAGELKLQGAHLMHQVPHVLNRHVELILHRLVQLSEGQLELVSLLLAYREVSQTKARVVRSTGHYELVALAALEGLGEGARLDTSLVRRLLSVPLLWRLLLLTRLHSIERMFECRLSEREGPALEQYGRLARRHRVCLEQCAFRLIREHVVILQVEVSEAAVLVREHVLNEWS
jgi:hypothetical protein